MLERLAKGTARFFVEQKAAESEFEEVYAYGAEIVYSTVLNGLIVLLMSVITGIFIPTLVFIISFILLRRSAGGFHASTHTKCMLILVAVHLLFVLCVNFLNIAIVPYFSYFTILYSCISVFLFAPVEHPNKPLKSHEIMKLRGFSISAVMLLSISIIILIFSKKFDFAFFVSYGVFVSVTGLLVEKLRQRVIISAKKIGQE